MSGWTGFGPSCASRDSTPSCCSATPTSSTPPGRSGHWPTRAGPTSSSRSRSSWSDDEWPHLFSPMREDDRLRAELPSDHLHGPVYLDFDEGVQLFASQLAGLVPANAVIAIDEWTNALRRERSILFAPRRTGRRRTSHQHGQGDQDAGRAVVHARGPADHRTRHRRRAGAASRPASARPTSPRRSCARSSRRAPTPTSSTRSGR